MSDPDICAQIAYLNGSDPIEYAVAQVVLQVDTRDQIRRARVHSPGAYPVFHGDLGDEATARRVVAALLDAGWTPPTARRCETHFLPGNCMPSTCGPAVISQPQPACPECDDQVAPGRYCPTCGRYEAEPDADPNGAR